MTDDRDLLAHHEAGHAVAVLLRGGGEFKSITLRDDGSGICDIRSKSFDRPFISYAGPYAEGRRQMEIQVHTDPDRCLTLQDYVTGVLLCQPADCDDYLAGIRDLQGPDPTIVWENELGTQWSAITRIAKMLLADESVSADEIEAMLYV